MAGEFKLKYGGAKELEAALLDIAPELRRGPGARALRAGAKPVLDRAIQETPSLTQDLYRNGKLFRRAGTLRRALRIRASRDVNQTGDVGVFVNIKPLSKGAIRTFKEATGRRSSQNPDDNFYWKFVHFATRTNKNPRPFLTRAGQLLNGTSLPIIISYLQKYFATLNSKK